MTLVFRQRGMLYPGINQHDMVIRVRWVIKLAICAFAASYSGCQCPGNDRDFLAFA